MSTAEGQAPQVHVRLAAAGRGESHVGTGLAVLDHLIGELAAAAPFALDLEVAPDSVGAEAVAAGRALGEALFGALRAPAAAGRGFAWLPADEALAGAVLETSERPLLASNVDFSGQRVGGLEGDVVARFLEALAESASLNIHIRVLEGKDPENVMRATFKALGAALGQAMRRSDHGRER